MKDLSRLIVKFLQLDMILMFCSCFFGWLFYFLDQRLAAQIISVSFFSVGLFIMLTGKVFLYGSYVEENFEDEE